MTAIIDTSLEMEWPRQPCGIVRLFFAIVMFSRSQSEQQPGQEARILLVLAHGAAGSALEMDDAVHQQTIVFSLLQINFAAFNEAKGQVELFTIERLHLDIPWEEICLKNPNSAAGSLLS